MYPPANTAGPQNNLVPSQRDELSATTDASKSVRSPLVKATASTKKQVDEDGDAKRDLLEEARLRFRGICEYEEKFRRRAIDELNFVDNMDHWKPEQREERKGLPCLSFDKIGPSCDQVVNNMRQSPPEGRMSPVGDGADKEEAKILQGINRNVDQDSGADTARTTAFEHAVKIGIGWWREWFDWETDVTEGDNLQDCFLQKLCSKRVPSPFSIYSDPAAMEYDKSDMRYLFATEDLDPVAFKEEHPDASTSMTTDFTHLSDKEKDDWFPGKKSIRVAEYWWKEAGPKETVLMLSTGKVVKLADFKADTYPASVYEIGRREIKRPRIKMQKMTGVETLGPVTEWKGRWIPFPCVIGREVLVDGRVAYRGMIRPSMEANLAYDYMASKETQAIALAPMASFIAASGQVDNHPEWHEANRKAHDVLTYDAIDVNGTMVPPPQRANTEANIMAITQALQARGQDIRESLNTWGPDLGQPEGDQSGKAIGAIQQQGDNAHFNYADNYARAIRHATRIRLDLMPHVYSEERAITIMDPDGKVRSVEINKNILVDGVKRMWRVGKDFDPARYDVTIGTGTPYASLLRQQTDSVLQLVSNNPQAGARALDLIAKMLDLPQEFIDRWRPPDVQQDQDNSDPNNQPTVTQMVQKLQGQQSTIAMLAQQLTAAADEIKMSRLKYESQERIAAENNKAKILAAALTSRDAAVNAQAERDAQAESAALDRRADLLRAGMDVTKDAQQDAAEAALLARQAAQQQQADQAAQTSQQNHEASLQAADHGHDAAMQQQAAALAPPPAPAQPPAGA